MRFVQRNILDVVTPPRRAKTQMQTLTEEQVHQLLDVIEGDRFEALYILALSTGMREGELLGLRWKDINLERASLQLQVSLQRSGNTYILAEPKTDHSRRRIGLARHAVEALRRHRVRQNEERLRLGAAWDDSFDLVFPNGIGRPIQPHIIGQTQFHRHLEKAGLPQIRFHDLRHTVATLLLQRGINAKVVSEMLGHSNISITLGIYAHVTPHMQETAIMAIDLILSKGA
ncbi:MAG: site-specific integrase [Ktedonobacterales bacterium]|nr:site-specific integrase [Ktedonobacterales bacterium]